MRTQRHDTTHDSDADLLVAARHDREAFGTFYDRHASNVLTFFARRVLDPEVAADLTAETFAAALRDLRGFNPRKGSGTKWLYGIARHELSHWWRHAEVVRRATERLGMDRIELDEESYAYIEFLIDARAAADTVREMLGQLSANQRDALMWKLGDGLSYEQIAQLGGCTVANARTRVSRGLAKIARLWEMA